MAADALVPKHNSNRSTLSMLFQSSFIKGALLWTQVQNKFIIADK